MESKKRTRVYYFYSAVKFFFLLGYFSTGISQSLKIDITGVGQTLMPIAYAPFYTETEEENKFNRILRDVVQADLRRTAAFNLLPLPPLKPALRHDLELSSDFFDTWRNLTCGTASSIGALYSVLPPLSSKFTEEQADSMNKKPMATEQKTSSLYIYVEKAVDLY